jgi:S-formylglutathione hydrolase FrmB
MGARHVGRRLLAGLIVLIFAAGCGVGPTPAPSPTTPSPVSIPSAANTPTVTAPVAPASTPVRASGPSGSMTTYRLDHTATLLADGRVLLAGGFDASAELYDPKTGAFTTAGTLGAVLISHTATLLADGRVLIAGGTAGDKTVAWAMLFDPKTGTFSPTGSMATPRRAAAATLLADGRVLIAGGDRNPLISASPAPLASAELYDPKSGTFSQIGSMTAPRMAAASALLADGRVLVTGGSPNGSLSLASAEIYDPRTGTFSATGSMGTVRSRHTATSLPDGRVLVAGGFDGGGNTSSAELYDPKTGMFGPTGSMADTRDAQTATLLPEGRVLIAGGETSDSQTSRATAELYDPKIGTFTATASMATPRSGHTATLLADGRVLVAGGSDAGFLSWPSVASAELYDPQTGTFTSTGSVLPAIGRPADDGARIINATKVDTRIRDLTIDSPAVGRIVKVRLLVPSGFDAQPSTRWPLLYLLDGGPSFYADWTSFMGAEALTAPTNLLVVTPDAGNGFYSDWWNGGAGGPPAWETFHLVELRQLLERNWHAGDKRAIAGASMGGFGAFEYAVRNPGMFLFAGSYSGGFDTLGHLDFFGGLPADLWGDPTTQADVWKAHDALLNAAALKGTALYVAYGNGQPGPFDNGKASTMDPTGATEQQIHLQGTSFVKRLAELKIPVTVYDYGNGTHSFPYMQRDFERSLPLILQALGE